jgi:squalene-hopene/tetraprenyl-beta-curcumene cyclase
MNEWDRIVQIASRFLLEEGESGFPEAAHTLSFPAAQGFDVQEDTQTDAVFARALIAEALVDLRDGSAAIGALLDREVEWLLDARQRQPPGGWKYFRSLRELPPDADDLGQIMRVLLLAGRQEDARIHCEMPLQVLLRDGMHADGSFETWIVPRENRSPEQNAQAHWIDVAWGRGADTEVMANLLYALHLYDANRFADVIAKGTSVIAARAEADGSFRSTWYHGPHYGTYVVARLLAACEPHSPALAAAIRFTIDAMTAEAWGDPLNTALALLTLGTVPEPSADVIRCAGEGCRALSAATLSGTFAMPYPFIRMDLGRPSGIIHQTLTWSSGTITAAFVARAAKRWGELTFHSQ